RRRIDGLRPREVPGAGRIRPALSPVLSRRHRPFLLRLAERMEGLLPAAKPRVSRAPRHHRQALFARGHPRLPEEKLRADGLEKRPPLAMAPATFLLPVRPHGAVLDGP